jgi:hypothetical protein
MGGNPLIVKSMFVTDPVKQALLDEDVKIGGDVVDSKGGIDIDSKPPPVVENGDVKMPLMGNGEVAAPKEVVDFKNIAPRELNKTAGRYSMIDETSTNMLLDLPELHCDMNNYRKSL